MKATRKQSQLHCQNHKNTRSLCGEKQSMVIEPTLVKDPTSLLLSNISQCKYFSILADEKIDVSQTEQLSLSVRFIKDTKVHEEFFVLCSGFFNNRQRSCIYDSHPTISTWALEHMRGQGYDGASNMSGKYRGVQARVKELYPLAMYTHCCNHVINLVISTSSQLPVVRNAMATISDICVFLSRSAQRMSIFQDKFEREVSGSASSQQKLKPICATHW